MVLPLLHSLPFVLIGLNSSDIKHLVVPAFCFFGFCLVFSASSKEKQKKIALGTVWYFQHHKRKKKKKILRLGLFGIFLGFVLL